MPKAISFRRGLMSVLFWSIISAAFIGPGTVTTASKAGASYQMSLLWALIFSIFSTIILQEAAARITIASGKSLGEIIALRYAQGNNRRLRILVFSAIAFGCAAYQAGNILGAISGLGLLGDIPQELLILLIGLMCFVLLWIGSYRLIANMLGLIVAIMGIVFIYVALRTNVGLNSFLLGLRPILAEGSLPIVIGLIGTTIVPYNLFLASGISQGQDINEMRFGIITAVLIGGMISIAIMVVGTQVLGEFSFDGLAEAMSGSLGSWAAALFGIGLFAAGLSSSVTAPMAAAVTARSLFGAQSAKWSVQSINFRLVWGSILFIGLIFGITGVKPIPAILLAQVINGALLPIVAIFLLLAVNDTQLLPAKYTNRPFTNVLTILIVGITCFLGLNNIWKAIVGLWSNLGTWSRVWFYVDLFITIVMIGLLAFRVFKK